MATTAASSSGNSNPATTASPPAAPGLELMRRGGGQQQQPSQDQQQQPQYHTVARLYGSKLRYINGVASSYRGAYPAEPLAARGVSAQAFEGALDRVNNVLLMYWPCSACFFGGYLCTPCTLGLSLGGPRICVAEAEKYARFELECLNGSALFAGAGMRWELRKTCLRSWIEVQLAEREGEAAARGEQQQEQQEQQK